MLWWCWLLLWTGQNVIGGRRRDSSPHTRLNQFVVCVDYIIHVFFTGDEIHNPNIWVTIVNWVKGTKCDNSRTLKSMSINKLQVHVTVWVITLKTIVTTKLRLIVGFGIAAIPIGYRGYRPTLHAIAFKKSDFKLVMKRFNNNEHPT